MFRLGKLFYLLGTIIGVEMWRLKLGRRHTKRNTIETRQHVVKPRVRRNRNVDEKQYKISQRNCKRLVKEIVKDYSKKL